MPFASASASAVANVSSASNIQYIQDVIEGAVYSQFGGEYDEIIFKVNTKKQYTKIIIVVSFVDELAKTIRCATITLTIKDNKIININKSVRINDKKHKNDETIIKKINEMINQMANMMKINLTVVAIPGFNDSESNHFDIKELSIVPASISDTVKTVEKFIFDSCTSLIAMSNRMCAEINQIISPHIRRAEQHERINSVPVVSAAAEVSIVNDTNNFPAMNTRPRVNSPLLSNMELIYTSPHQPQRHNVISPIPVVNVSNNNNNNDTTQHFERKLEFLMNKAQEHARNLDETNNEIENVKRDFSKFKMYQQRRQREELERLEKEQEDELKKITEKFAERKKLLLESNSNNDGVSVTTQPVATFATIARETTPLMVQSATVHINEFVQQHIINPIQQTNSDVIIAKTVVIPVAEPIAVVSESVAVVSESVAVVSESVAVLVTSIPDVIEPVPTEITLYDEIAVIAEIVAEAEAETEEFIANTKPAVIEADENPTLWGNVEPDELPPAIETKTTTMAKANKSTTTTKPTQSNWIKCDNRQGNKRGKK